MPSSARPPGRRKFFPRNRPAAGTPAAPADGLWAAKRRTLTVGLVLTITFIASEALAVVTVMPVVAHDLGGLDLYGWVFSAFMLGSVVGIVAAGREADRRGPALPYVIGVILFASGLLVAGLTPSMPVLVAGRALQGLGAGAVPAVAYVAMGRTLPDRLRPRMMAVLSTAWAVPGVAGPAAAAAVAHLFGWRWVFLGLVPIVLVAGSLAIPALIRLGRLPRDEHRADERPPDERPRDEHRADRRSADRQPGTEHRVIDGLGVAAGAAMFLAGLTALSGSGASPVIGAVLVLAGCGLGIPVLRRLLPPGTLRARPGLPATILSRGVLTFAFFGADAYVTLTITTVRHHSPALAGLAVTGSTLGWTAGAWLQARLSERWAGRSLVRTGLAIVLAGQVGMALVLSPSVPVEVGMVAWTIAGFGMGMSSAPLSLMMLREAPPGREGWSSASLNLADVLGTAIGIGVGGAAVAAVLRSGHQVAEGVAIAFAITAAAAMAGLLVTRRLPLGRIRPDQAGHDSPEPDPAGPPAEGPVPEEPSFPELQAPGQPTSSAGGSTGRDAGGQAEVPHGLAVGDRDRVKLQVQLGGQVERDALGPL
jgi:MFS family permease